VQIFTLTTGRSGTAYLASLFRQNFPGCFAVHQRLSPTEWGAHPPDISVRMQFNTFGGNSPKVRNFFKDKAHLRHMEWSEEGAVDFYVETNHTLALSGLIENLRFFNDPKIVILERDPVEVVRSMYGRADLSLHVTIPWVWYLDFSWAKNLVKEMPQVGPASPYVWYVSEVMARARAYESTYGKEVEFVRADLKRITKRDGARSLFESLGLTPPEEITIPGKINHTVGSVILPYRQKVEEYFQRGTW
jgi:hypothetical protein